MTPLRIEARDDGTERRVRVFGEIDLLTVAKFRSALVGSQRQLVVDMRECGFMDLAGLRCLEEARENSPLTLIPSPPVLRLLELTATRHLFHIETGGFD